MKKKLTQLKLYFCLFVINKILNWTKCLNTVVDGHLDLSNVLVLSNNKSSFQIEKRNNRELRSWVEVQGWAYFFSLFALPSVSVCVMFITKLNVTCYWRVLGEDLGTFRAHPSEDRWVYNTKSRKKKVYLQANALLWSEEIWDCLVILLETGQDSPSEYREWNTRTG